MALIPASEFAAEFDRLCLSLNLSANMTPKNTVDAVLAHVHSLRVGIKNAGTDRDAAITRARTMARAATEAIHAFEQVQALGEGAGLR